MRHNWPKVRLIDGQEVKVRDRTEHVSPRVAVAEAIPHYSARASLGHAASPPAAVMAGTQE
jgi:hypothetical protein